MQHMTISANGASFHLARSGAGKELLLLHGWPEFWLTWEPVMVRLAARHALIAPDLRGFGASSKLAGPWGAEEHAADLLALLDALGIGCIGIVGHDVGGAVMQVLARRVPQRIAGLFFFDFVYPGIGARMGEPGRLNEIWSRISRMSTVFLVPSRRICRKYQCVMVGLDGPGWNTRRGNRMMARGGSISTAV